MFQHVSDHFLGGIPNFSVSVMNTNSNANKLAYGTIKMLGLVAWHAVLWLRLVRGAARFRMHCVILSCIPPESLSTLCMPKTKNAECYMRAIYSVGRGD